MSRHVADHHRRVFQLNASSVWDAITAVRVELNSILVAPQTVLQTTQMLKQSVSIKMR